MEAPDEELLRSFALLLLDNKDHNVLPLQSDHITSHCPPDHCLTTKLISDRSPNTTGLWSALAMLKSWQPEGALDFIEAAKNTFLLIFELQADKWRILNGGPWYFSRDLLALSTFIPNLLVQRWSFTTSIFAVQFHGQPLEYHTKKTATDLSSKFNQLVDSDPFDSSKWQRFTRTHVTVDISKPLTVTVTDGSLHEVEVQYERLFRICTFCGLIGHELGDCPSRANPISTIMKDYPQHMHQALLALLQPKFINLAATT